MLKKTAGVTPTNKFKIKKESEQKDFNRNDIEMPDNDEIIEGFSEDPQPYGNFCFLLLHLMFSNSLIPCSTIQYASLFDKY